jgi:hypothetical protein
MVAERVSRFAFFGISTMAFAVSTALTATWCASMPTTGAMPMPGG